MALPRIRIDVDADTADAEAGLSRVRGGLQEMGNQADRTSRQTDRLNTRIRATGRDSRVFARGIQNIAYQMGDFATQVGAGTSASIALGQQLPQIFVGMGATGAVIGLVAAVAIPLARAFGQIGTNAETMNTILGTTRPLFEAIGSAISFVKDAGIAMAESIINNLDRIVIIALTAATAFGVRLVAGFVAAQVAAFSLSGALLFLRGALIRTGIGALIVGVGELVYQFTRLAQAAGGVGEAFSILGSLAVEVFGRIVSALQLVGEGFNNVAVIMEGAFMTAIGIVKSAFEDMINGMITGINAVGSAMDSLSGGRLGFSPIGGVDFGGSETESMGRNAMAIGRENLGYVAEDLGALLNSPLEGVQRIRDLLASIRDEGITLPDLLGVGAGAEEGGGGGGGGSARDRLDEELTAQEQRIAEHFNRVKALTVGGLSDKLGAWGDYFNNLASLTGTNNRRLLALGQAFRAAQALMDAWSAYTQVLADPSFVGRPFARLAAAGQVLAAGIGAVNAIRGVFAGGEGGGGSGGGSGGGGSGAAQAMAAEPLRTQNVVVDLVGANQRQVDQFQQFADTFNEARRQGLLTNVTVRGV
jgi:hypothetical protein